MADKTHIYTAIDVELADKQSQLIRLTLERDVLLGKIKIMEKKNEELERELQYIQQEKQMVTSLTYENYFNPENYDPVTNSYFLMTHE